MLAPRRSSRPIMRDEWGASPCVRSCFRVPALSAGYSRIPGGEMRRLGLIASGLAMSMALSGCASFKNREWGSCAIAGGIIGAAVGGITGGVVANNEDADDAVRGGAIAGGIVGGGAIGALLG